MLRQLGTGLRMCREHVVPRPLPLPMLRGVVRHIPADCYYFCGQGVEISVTTGNLVCLNHGGTLLYVAAQVSWH